MERVGVREFRDRATHYLSLGKPITVERHGEPIGYYIPLRRKRDPKEVERAIERLDAAVAAVLKETGMTEDELADLFDLNKPFPYE